MIIHELLHLKFYGMDQMLEKYLNALYGEDSGDPKRDSAYGDFMILHESTVNDSAKSLLSQGGDDKEISFGRFQAEVDKELGKYMDDIETTVCFYVRNDAFIINNILCGNMDFLWENICPMLDDNKGVLKEHEDGLRSPLDDITVKRLQSRIYREARTKNARLYSIWSILSLYRLKEPQYDQR